MKKKTVGLILCASLAVAVSACGSADSASGSAVSAESYPEEGDEIVYPDADSSEVTYENETQEQIMTVPIVDGDYNVDDCVLLGDYKNLSLTKSVTAVTDEEVQAYLESYVTAVEVDDPDAVVQVGDVAAISYVGKIDGEEFNGGTGDYDLEIGSGAFIDGFEDGLIGMKKGETRELELTFPDNYGEHSNQDVVFSVTVNSIKQKPELTDAWVAEYTGGEHQTIEDYKSAIRTELENENEATAESVLQGDAWSLLLESTTFYQLPAELYNSGVADYDASANAGAAQYGVTLEEYLELVGMSESAYETQKEQYGRYTAASRVMLDALVQAEDLSSESEEYQEELQAVADLYGVSAEELIADNGEDSVDMYVMTQLAMKKLIEYADITEVTVDG